MSRHPVLTAMLALLFQTVALMVLAHGQARAAADHLLAQQAVFQKEFPLVDRLAADLVAGSDPGALAAEWPDTRLDDLAALNRLRLALKTADKVPEARDFFKALRERSESDAVLMNLSLAHIDDMPGRSTLIQGYMSTRSQNVMAAITERDPQHWSAWFIQGINNLYWPDFFGKAENARDFLREAREVHLALDPVERQTHEFYARGYLALGDAYALLDEPDQARRTWLEGLRHYPYATPLQARLDLPQDAGALHEAVRARRDARKPVDTDLSFLWKGLSDPVHLVLTGGQLFGPGPLPDQPLDPGGLENLHLAAPFTGAIPPFNNGAAEPNLPGELRQGKVIDGLLSDGAEANEHVDVGFVSLMNGRFNLFLAAVQDGGHHGWINFFLDRNLHWTIYDDIGIDPGFPVGVVKFRDFIFSTGPRVLPVSRQTENGAPAGVDQAGSVASGEVIPGRLGDDDFDGLLDGMFNAIGRFPYDSVMLPGAPFAQTRVFTTNIPVSADHAALLTLANALSHRRLAIDLAEARPEAAARLQSLFEERLDLARRHAAQAADPAVRSLATVLNDAAPHDAALCALHERLNQVSAAVGLVTRDFDGSNVEICHL